MISVIMPTYNRAYVLNNAIDSVLGQTYDDWELIVVDDCSSDDTGNVVRKYMQRDSRIKYIRQEKNKGANACRNFGIKSAKGEYIALLDSDNVWYAHKLEKQIELLRNADDDIAVVYCREKKVDGENESNFPIDNFEAEDIKEILCQRNVIDSSTALIKKECFYKIGFFDETLPRLQEWEFFIRLLVVHNYKALFINEILNVSYIQNDSISKNSEKYFTATTELMKRYPEYFEKSIAFQERVMWEMLNNSENLEYALEKILENPYGWKNMLLNVIKIASDKNNQKNQNRIMREENELLYNWKIKTSKNQGQSILLNYFKKEDSRIAIYGLGKWGELLYQDLCNTSIRITCGIDKKVTEFHELEIRRPGDEIGDVDYIIIAVLLGTEDIKLTLQEKYKAQIVVLKDFIRRY